MKRKLSAIAIWVVLFLAGTVSLWADGGLGPWNHSTNPAFFAFGNREFVELGMSANTAIGNSALGLSDVFSRVLVIDLDEVYSNTPDDGLRIGARTPRRKSTLRFTSASSAWASTQTRTIFHESSFLDPLSD